MPIDDMRVWILISGVIVSLFGVGNQERDATVFGGVLFGIGLGFIWFG